MKKKSVGKNEQTKKQTKKKKGKAPGSGTIEFQS
jgi:hypothetical protein